MRIFLILLAAASVCSADLPPELAATQDAIARPIAWQARSLASAAEGVDEVVGRMDPVWVSAGRLRLAAEDMLTSAGRMELARKTQLTESYRAVIGPLAQLATYYYSWPSLLAGWHPNEAEAMLLYEQELRIRRVGEVDRLTNLQIMDAGKDPRAARAIQKEMRELRLDFRSQRRGRGLTD